MKLEGTEGRRPLLVPAGAVPHARRWPTTAPRSSRSSRRRGRSRPPHPAARRAHLGVLPQHGPRQEERRARPQERAGPRRSVPAAPARPTCWSNSFRPGVAARFGIGYEAVKAANPGIVYCSISAFGQDGAYPGRAAHDLALEAMTGVLSLTLGDDGRPGDARHPDRRPGERPARPLGRADGAACAAQTTGKGDYIDVCDARGADGLLRQRRRPGLHRGHAARRQEPAHHRRLGLLSRLRHVATAASSCWPARR